MKFWGWDGGGGGGGDPRALLPLYETLISLAIYRGLSVSQHFIVSVSTPLRLLDYRNFFYCFLLFYNRHASSAIFAFAFFDHACTYIGYNILLLTGG